MHKMLIMVGASALAFGALSDSAEARKRYYEINGQRYSYETRDPAQVAIARKRIEAANALDAAKAKAAAERAQNPLTAVFGSPAQREAREAEARLQQVLAQSQTTEFMRSSQDRRNAASERRSTQPADRTENAPAVEQAALQKKEAAPEKPVIAPTPPAVAEPLQQHVRKKVKSVSFDVETGIKTVIMTDGSAEEEPFDSSVLSQLVPENGKSNSLTAFINQLRKVPPEDATGSVKPAPAPEAAAHP